VSRVTKIRVCDRARAYASYRLTSLFHESTVDKPFHVQLKHNVFSYVKFKSRLFHRAFSATCSALNIGHLQGAL
jgi:hypothetical protein